MRKNLAFLAIVMLLAPLSLWAKGPTVELEPLTGRMDIHKLVPFLSRGELSFVESRPSGKLKQITVVGLVRAKPSRVWEVLTDYEHYASFIPSVVECEVVKRQKNEVVVTFEIEVPGSNVEYTRRDRHFPPDRIEMWVEDEEGDILTGGWRWELVPHAGGSQTILVLTAYYDVADTSWIVRQMMDSNPTTEHGLNVASGQVAVRAMKKRAEQPGVP
jgi:ribosome-associated toxin RatA of RatAB toxin-antitoxin module